MVDEVVWLVSGWDHQVHAFPVLGEVASEAACTHTAMTGRLTEPTGREQVCPACALLRPIELQQLVSAHTLERDRWAP